MPKTTPTSYSKTQTAKLLKVPRYLLEAMEQDKQITRKGRGYDGEQVRALVAAVSRGIDPNREYTTVEAAILMGVIPRMVRYRCQHHGLGRKAGQIYLINGRDMEDELVRNEQRKSDHRRVSCQEIAVRRHRERAK